LVGYNAAVHATVPPRSPLQRFAGLEKIVVVTIFLAGLLVWRLSPALFSERFLPHRYCYLARPDLIWSNVVTDSIIFLSYVSIFWSLSWVARRSSRLLVRTMVAFFVAFGIFILACGLTHLMEVIVIWFPFYWLSVAVKVVTAVASGVTAVAFAVKKGLIVEGIAAYRERLEISEREREHAVSALVTADKLAELGRLSASISHEINNPLEAVMNIVYFARTHAALPPELREMLDAADAELRRVATISHTALAFYRQSTAPSRVNLRSIIQSAMDLLASAARAREVTLVADLNGDSCIEAYEGGVRQVVLNLLRNAIEASERNGVVRITAEPATDAALDRPGYRIIIADQGRGIPEAMQPNLFRPAPSSKPEGNGIGLWIVRQIVDKHGGSITVHSQTAEPSGTEVTVWFPTRFALGVLDPEKAPDTPSVAGVRAKYLSNEGAPC
jgi:signal transduction histidine kinase